MENNDSERNEMSPAIIKWKTKYVTMGTGLKCNRKIVERVEIDTLTHTHIYMTVNVSGIVQVLRKKIKTKTNKKYIAK